MVIKNHKKLGGLVMSPGPYSGSMLIICLNKPGKQNKKA